MLSSSFFLRVVILFLAYLRPSGADRELSDVLHRGDKLTCWCNKGLDAPIPADCHRAIHMMPSGLHYSPNHLHDPPDDPARPILLHFHRPHYPLPAAFRSDTCTVIVWLWPDTTAQVAGAAATPSLPIEPLDLYVHVWPRLKQGADAVVQWCVKGESPGGYYGDVVRFRDVSVIIRVAVCNENKWGQRCRRYYGDIPKTRKFNANRKADWNPVMRKHRMGLRGGKGGEKGGGEGQG
ncbi:hypothetical protein MMC30_007756 [Trapelia coarctata]|nr:hypothetical protein [Trapelia coarctata]